VTRAADVQVLGRSVAGPGARRRAPGTAVQLLLAALVLLVVALPTAYHYLVQWPQDQWQVDVEVYREAARSVVYGRPLYDQLTEPPQLLPFTYPPFAALVALPLAMLPFRAVGVLWTVAQVLATYATVLLAFRPLLARASAWRWVAGAALTAPVLWMLPVSDGIRFGQINAFIVLLCTADLLAVRAPWARWTGARGALIGLATAIKLTPGVFLLHFVWSRRWREAFTVAAAAAFATVLAFLVLPEASLAFWGGALSDPARLGPNAGTTNQSLRGVLLRLGPDGASGTALWMVLVATVGAVGFTVARRAAAAGDRVSELAAVGLMAVLLSPVAWIHHFAWMTLAVAALAGDGRSRRRLVMAGVVLAWFLTRMPWWGVAWIEAGWPIAIGRLLQNAYLLGALLALGLLWRVVPRGAAEPNRPTL